ncbi:GntR family transcriptional regulator [Saccharopolyspora spinosa]|uniref:GntR family transcriptional regulator n=1 Tax=Saccharopolyspora spinosa TaxID=60894 RepID=UPI0002378CFB
MSLWVQVAADLESQMDAGDLSPGSPLPSNVELAQLCGVARVTVQRAVLELRKQGRLIVVTGRDTFVTQQNGRQDHP